MSKIKLEAALITALLATGAATAVAAGSTQTHITNPFTSSGKPAVKVSHTYVGACFAGSIPAPRRRAWRCISSGSQIVDPCFSSPKAKGIVLCAVEGPWAPFIRLNLTKPLKPGQGNQKPASTTGWPWALKTTTGLKCLFNYNMQMKRNGRFQTYICNHQKSLWGKISRATSLWTIHSSSAGSARAKIAVAWF